MSEMFANDQDRLHIPITSPRLWSVSPHKYHASANLGKLDYCESSSPWVSPDSAKFAGLGSWMMSRASNVRFPSPLHFDFVGNDQGFHGL